MLGTGNCQLNSYAVYPRYLSLHVCALYGTKESFQKGVITSSRVVAQVPIEEARDTLKLWYRDRQEVLAWQKIQKKLAREKCEVYTLLGRSRHFRNLTRFDRDKRGHIERAAINAPVQVLITNCGSMVMLHCF